MIVNQIAGEPTRFYVESTVLECQACKKGFSRRDRKFKDLAPGEACPGCTSGQLELKYHLVDLSCFRPIGECSCEHFQFRLSKELAKLPPATLYKLTQGQAAKFRCTHIEAARSLALDLTVEQHEQQRHAAAGRQREGVGA
jgi:hypothetical protein